MGKKLCFFFLCVFVFICSIKKCNQLGSNNNKMPKKKKKKKLNKHADMSNSFKKMSPSDYHCTGSFKSNGIYLISEKGIGF